MATSFNSFMLGDPMISPADSATTLAAILKARAAQQGRGYSPGNPLESGPIGINPNSGFAASSEGRRVMGNPVPDVLNRQRDLDRAMGASPSASWAPSGDLGTSIKPRPYTGANDLGTEDRVLFEDRLAQAAIPEAATMTGSSGGRSWAMAPTRTQERLRDTEANKIAAAIRLEKEQRIEQEKLDKAAANSPAAIAAKTELERQKRDIEAKKAAAALAYQQSLDDEARRRAYPESGAKVATTVAAGESATQDIKLANARRRIERIRPNERGVYTAAQQKELAGLAKENAALATEIGDPASTLEQVLGELKASGEWDNYRNVLDTVINKEPGNTWGFTKLFPADVSKKAEVAINKIRAAKRRAQDVVEGFTNDPVLRNAMGALLKRDLVTAINNLEIPTLIGVPQEHIAAFKQRLLESLYGL